MVAGRMREMRENFGIPENEDGDRLRAILAERRRKEAEARERAEKGEGAEEGEAKEGEEEEEEEEVYSEENAVHPSSRRGRRKGKK